MRMCTEDVLYVCGTDEHGVPITITAEKMGITPREVVDRFHEVIADDFSRMGISFDNFSRTERPEHYRFAQEVFLDLLGKGLIVERHNKQFYCGDCSRFLPDRYVGGTCPRCGAEGARGDQCEKCGSWLDALELVRPVCSICGSEPVPRETGHWFLRLDAFQDWLEEWLESHGDWRNNVLNYCSGWLRDGLHERAITRDLDWGVPVPIKGAEGKVLYVWFEALLGYISSTREYFESRGEPDRWKDYWKDPDTRLVHFIGKDNIVFHAVIEPAVLKGLGDFVLPWNVPANEYLNIGGEKFSTSRGTAIWMKDYLEHLPPDPLRYALAANAPEGRDTDFTWEDFRVKNNEIADVFGNFTNRTLKFAHSFFDGRVPDPSAAGEAERELLASAAATRDRMEALLREFRIKAACAEVMDLAREGNRYFDRVQPWKTAKTDQGRLCCSHLVQSSAHRCAPDPHWPPSYPSPLRPWAGCLAGRPWSGPRQGVRTWSPGHLGSPEILFSKLKKGFEKYSSPPRTGWDPAGEGRRSLVSYDRFMETELRVGRILQAAPWRVRTSSTACRWTWGTTHRELVAGIRPWYTTGELEGRLVAVVANLEPAKIRGILSRRNDPGLRRRGRRALLSPGERRQAGDRIR